MNIVQQEPSEGLLDREVNFRLSKKTRDYWIYNPDNKHPRHEDLKEVPIGRLVSQGTKFSKPSEGFLK